ncbi:hypothetical protein FQR65_LT09862 [Abscondita terminalis]|nr:hypothetical protein FQR65_LT09862 [Abscondita terminalis]
MIQRKHVVIFFIVVNVSFCVKFREDAVEFFKKITQPFVNECLEYSNLNIDDLDVMYNGGYVPDTEAMSCYLSCAYKKLNIIDMNGNIKPPALLYKDASYYIPIIERCKDEALTEKNDCKKALLLATCIGRHLPDNVAEIWGNMLAPYTDECQLEAHSDAEDIDMMFNGGYIPMHAEMGCYLKCVFLKLKMLDSNGNFDLKYLQTTNLSFLKRELVDECLELIVGENDLCQKSLVFGDCIDQGLSV